MKAFFSFIAAVVALAIIATIGLAAILVRSTVFLCSGADVGAYLVTVARALDIAGASIIYNKRGWTLSQLAHHFGKKHSESAIFEGVINVLAYPFDDGWAHCRRSYLYACRRRKIKPYSALPDY